MIKNDNYNSRKVLYNPSLSSVFLLIIMVGFVYLILKNDHLKYFLIQQFTSINDFLKKTFLNL